MNSIAHKSVRGISVNRSEPALAKPNNRKWSLSPVSVQKNIKTGGLEKC
jgi:hypothetical protein